MSYEPLPVTEESVGSLAATLGITKPGQAGRHAPSFSFPADANQLNRRGLFERCFPLPDCSVGQPNDTGYVEISQSFFDLETVEHVRSADRF